jgi:hypothetical protein
MKTKNNTMCFTKLSFVGGKIDFIGVASLHWVLVVLACCWCEESGEKIVAFQTA